MKKMPPLFKLLRNGLIEGVLVGWLLLALLLLTNVGGFSDKILGTQSSVLAIVLMGLLFAITFGSAAMGIAIMTMPREDGPKK